MAKTLSQLRKEYPTFKYQSFKWEVAGADLSINFKFEMGDVNFSPKVILRSVDTGRLSLLDASTIDNLVFSLGLVEMLSYWKATCSEVIEVSCGSLSSEQVKWWKKLIFKGMGEFFYVNKIEVSDNFVEIKSSGQRYQRNSDMNSSAKILLSLSAGVDSSVAASVFQSENLEGFMLNPTSLSLENARVLGIQTQRIVNRGLDPALLELNNQGYLNGHTPFSAYLSFLGALSSYIYGTQGYYVANEESANEGNMEWNGIVINHQYSKSYEYEKDFREYCSNYLLEGFEYKSVVRPLRSVQLVGLFANLKKSIPFSSCDKAMREGKMWCEACSKCFFMYIALSVFWDREHMSQHFHTDMLNDKNFKSEIDAFLDDNLSKPLNCVGTKDETVSAIEMIHFRYKVKNKNVPEVIRYAMKMIGESADWESRAKATLEFWSGENFLSEKESSVLKTELSKANLMSVISIS